MSDRIHYCPSCGKEWHCFGCEEVNEEKLCDGCVSRRPEAEKFEATLSAALTADWQQVVLNGGPPCFHLEEDGSFCFRAERWLGHGQLHEFVSLNRLLKELLA